MTVARRKAGDKTRLTGRPTDPTGDLHGFFTGTPHGLAPPVCPRAARGRLPARADARGLRAVRCENPTRPGSRYVGVPAWPPGRTPADPLERLLLPRLPGALVRMPGRP